MTFKQRLAGWLPITLLATACAWFTLWLFWPGYMSWDSADQWRQALSGDFNDIAPPVMGLIWRQIDRLIPGPGGMLLLQVLLWWGCIAFAVYMTQIGRPRRATLLLLAIGFWPALWAVLPHIWKDVWMALAFTGALLLLLQESRHPSRGLRAGSILLLAIGCAFRHNAILGALPILWWIATRELSGLAARPRPSRRLALLQRPLLTAALALAVMLAAGLPTRLAGAQRIHDQWAVVSIWDMAAISLHEEQMLVPSALINRPFTLDELRGKFTAYSNTTIFGTGMFRNPFFGELTTDERRAVYSGWLGLAWDHPGAYLAHRGRLSALLFGLDPAGLPDSLVLSPRLVHLEGNPALQPERPRLQRRVQDWLNARIDGPFFAGWIYALAALALAILGWRQRDRHAHDGLASVAATSGLLYALPLCVLSGSAEFRYLFWMILSVGLAALLAFSSPATREADSN